MSPERLIEILHVTILWSMGVKIHCSDEDIADVTTYKIWIYTRISEIPYDSETPNERFNN